MVEIIPSLKICKSVAPQSIGNRFIGPLVLLWFADWLRIDSNALWLLLWLLIDWELIQMLSGCYSDCWSIENRFKYSLVALICWSIENRFKYSLVALICWSIGNRFGSPLIHHPNSQLIDNRFKIFHQTSKRHKIFIRCPNEVIQKPIIVIFARLTKWRNSFFSIPWYTKWGG